MPNSEARGIGRISQEGKEEEEESRCREETNETWREESDIQNEKREKKNHMAKCRLIKAGNLSYKSKRDKPKL